MIPSMAAMSGSTKKHSKGVDVAGWMSSDDNSLRYFVIAEKAPSNPRFAMLELGLLTFEGRMLVTEQELSTNLTVDST